MEWVQVENRPDRKFKHYYVVNEEDLLIFKDGEKILCKLSDNSEKQLTLTSKRYEVVHYENGIHYHSYTDEWFVKDDKEIYSIEDVKISKNDIEQYKGK